MLIVHIQCLLRVDGRILAGVFLTSFFYVVPESPFSSDAVTKPISISSLVLELFSAATSTKSTVASETGGCSAPYQFRSQLPTVKRLL